jgi:hypothetical protein
MLNQKPDKLLGNLQTDNGIYFRPSSLCRKFLVVSKRGRALAGRVNTRKSKERGKAMDTKSGEIPMTDIETEIDTLRELDTLRVESGRLRNEGIKVLTALLEQGNKCELLESLHVSMALWEMSSDPPKKTESTSERTHERSGKFGIQEDH